MTIRERLQAIFAGRPWWMNATMVFCAYMAFIYVPWDFLAKPIDRDEEVWFGIVLHGWAAKATEPLHWFIYAAGTWGFRHMRSWMHPWAAIYVLQVAISMLVWSLLDPRSPGPFLGLVSMLPFLVLAAALLHHRVLFAPRVMQEAPGND